MQLPSTDKNTYEKVFFCKEIDFQKRFRIKKFNISEIEYLGLKLNIENNDDLLNKILKVYD